MGNASARVTDQVRMDNCGTSSVCGGCSHGSQIGIFRKGASGTTINNLKAVRLTDQGIVNCPHSGQFVVVKASSNVFIEGKLAARVGDLVQCLTCKSMGTIIRGSPSSNTKK